VAEAEIALACRDLAWPQAALDAARATLEAHGDRTNAAHARYLQVRRLLLIGRVDEAERALADLDPSLFPPAARAVHQLITAGVAMRRFRARAARAAMAEARAAAGQAAIPALSAEIERAAASLEAPAARRVGAGGDRAVRLDEVETLLNSDALVVDGLRHLVSDGRSEVALARRPVLFALVRALGEAWPADVSRDRLVRLAFGGREADESHRARLRVEMGRLRAVLRPIAGVSATGQGFILKPRHASEVVVLARPVEERHASVLALLGDGESWSSSALALALGASQRTVQRALEDLSARGRAQALGQGKARRWMIPPVAGTTTPLLLPPSLPAG
jgi:hypothetical protein